MSSTFVSETMRRRAAECIKDNKDIATEIVIQSLEVKESLRNIGNLNNIKNEMIRSEAEF